MSEPIALQIRVDDDGSIVVEEFTVNTEKRLKQLGRTIDKTTKVMKNGWKSVIKTLFNVKTMLASLAGGAGIALLSRSFLDASKVTEGYRTRLQYLLGSVEKGKQLFNDMSAYAGKVAFEYKDIMGAATQLSGVMQGSVVKIKQWMPLIGDLAAATGLDIQTTTEQISRMYSAGAASADLFRERGVLAMLGFKAGVTYSVEETRKKLMEAWTKVGSSFKGAAQGMADTWEGKMSMISDIWFEFRNLVMDAGLFDTAKRELQSIIDKINEMRKTGEWQYWATAVGGAINIMYLSIKDFIVWIWENGPQAMKALYAGVKLVGNAFEGWKAIWYLLAALFNEVVIVPLWTGLSKVRSGITDMFKMVSDIAARLPGKIPFFKGIQDAITGWEANSSRILEEQNTIIKGAKNTAEDYRQKIIDLAKTSTVLENINAIFELISTSAEAGEIAIDKLKERLTEVRDVLIRIEKEGHKGPFKEMGVSADKAFPGVEKISRHMKGIAESVNDIVKSGNKAAAIMKLLGLKDFNMLKSQAVGAAVGGALGNSRTESRMDRFANIVEKWTGSFSSLDGIFKSFLGRFGGIIAIILNIIREIASGSVLKNIRAIHVELVDFGKQFIEMHKNVANESMMAVTEGFTRIFEESDNFVREAIRSIPKFFKDMFTHVPYIIEALLSEIPEIFDVIIEEFGNAWNSFLPTIEDTFNTLLYGGTVDSFADEWEKEMEDQELDVTVNLDITNAMNALKFAQDQLLGALNNTDRAVAREALLSAREAAILAEKKGKSKDADEPWSREFKGLMGVLGDIWKTIEIGVSDIWDAVEKGGNDIWYTVEKGVNDIWGTLEKGIGDIWNTIWKGIQDIIDELKRVGGDLFGGSSIGSIGGGGGGDLGKIVDPVGIFGGGGFKFHSGGIITDSIYAHSGLRLMPDEVPIIAQTGEGVLSRRGMKAFDEMNQGRVPGGGQTVNQTNHYHIEVVTDRDGNIIKMTKSEGKRFLRNLKPAIEDMQRNGELKFA